MVCNWLDFNLSYREVLPFDLGWELWFSFVKLVSFQEPPASSTAWWTPIPVVSFPILSRHSAQTVVYTCSPPYLSSKALPPVWPGRSCTFLWPLVLFLDSIFSGLIIYLCVVVYLMFSSYLHCRFDESWGHICIPPPSWCPTWRCLVPSDCSVNICGMNDYTAVYI